MPCRLCKSPIGKSELSHSLTPGHRKKLLARMQQKKKKSEEKYGVFIYSHECKSKIPSLYL